MKHKIITLFLTLATSVGTMFADRVLIGNLYYNLNDETKTAEVTYELERSMNNYKDLSGELSIPESATYNSVPYSVTSIGESAFDGCTGLTSVTIPNSVTKIGYMAFNGCSGLTSVTIPNSVTYISHAAFRGCSGLTSVTIPNSVTTIGVEAFSGCSGLPIIDNIRYADTYLVEAVDKTLSAYTIKEETKWIGEDAFRGCSGLTSVTIPNSVTSIGQNAFYGCTGLTSIEIPNSVTSIGNRAFSGCSGLTSVTIPNSVTSIGQDAFSGCKGLTSVTIPNSVTSIGWYAFDGCTGLTSVTIPNSVTTIGVRAFGDCTGLTSVTIGNSVTWIGDGAFEYCSGLTTITVDATNTNYCDVDGVLFNKEKTMLIQYPAKKSETEYTLPNSVTEIGPNAFACCKGLTSVTIPNSVTEIGWGAFQNCIGLTSVTIGNSVTKIGMSVFRGCSGLTSVTIPNSVTYIVADAFSYCTGLTAITVEAANPNYCDVDGVLFNKEKTTLILYPAKKSGTEYTIPESVTSIGVFAFYGCTGLTAITVEAANPNYCDVDGVLFNKEKTRLIQYPAKKSGTEYTIPNSVTEIDWYAFRYCSGLTSITCEAVTPPSCAEKVFEEVDKSIPVYVPAGSVKAYKAADQWTDFGDNIQPIQAADADVTDIEAEPMDNSVVIEWPSVAEATIYTIEIRKNGELICTLTFNELGQLQSIAFAKPSRNGGRDSQVRTATQTTTGWQYTIAGLEPNTTYTYNVIAKRNTSDTDNLYDKTITFTTKNAPTGIDAVVGTNSQVKQILNGQLLIIRNGEVYNATGARVE